MVNREQLVSVVGGRAARFVNTSKPSELIPFKGKFPLLETWEVRAYQKAIQGTELIENLPPRFQEIVMKGSRMALMEQGFRQYLSQRNISEVDFQKLDSPHKSDYLIDWMNTDCIDFSSLKIN